ncbi:MAG TPA: DUF3566 domain-containing protein [Nocardioidaceae bacterium]|nr:DUF3566 domain-containing protein [Nocardioidaceae bacterium]
MTERRTEDTALPRRSLAASSDARAPLSDRVAAAIASAGQTVQAGPGTTTDRVAPVTRPTSRAAQPVAQPASPAPEPIGQRFENVHPSGPAPTAAPRRVSVGSGRVRRARLRLTHVDPWSVMKTAFLLSVAIGIVTVVAVAVVWGVLGVAGVWDSINKTVIDVIGGDSGDTFDIRDYLGTSRVMGFTMIVAVVDVVLITAIATLGAFLYNLSAALLGGLEVTLTEDEH